MNTDICQRFKFEFSSCVFSLRWDLTVWVDSAITFMRSRKWLCSHCFTLRSLRGSRFNPPGEITGHLWAFHLNFDIFVVSFLCRDFFSPFHLMFHFTFINFLLYFRGCLFYGPPGTGKTLVARALANECSHGDRKVSFFMRKGADCLSKWVGESERQLRLLFDQVRYWFNCHDRFPDLSLLLSSLDLQYFHLSPAFMFNCPPLNIILTSVLLLIRLTWWGHLLFSLMKLMDWLQFAQVDRTRYTGKDLYSKLIA